MKIAVVGAGAMGSVYCGLFAEAGHEVWAVDVWEDHIREIRMNGLRVAGASGDRIVRLNATTDVSQVGTCDLIVIATKASGVASAARSIRSNIGAETVILTIQNGLGAGERIAQHLSTDRVLLGVAGGFGASIKAPGWVHHNGMELIRIGELHGGLTDRAEAISKVWREAGFQVRAYDDIEQLVWEKFICNVTFSAPCTVFAKTIGELMADPHAWPVALQCGREAYEVALARQIRLSFEDFGAYVSAFGRKMPDARPSMLLDHLASRPSEIDAINGIVGTVAAEAGLTAPYNEVLSAIVRSREAAFSSKTGSER